MEEVISYIYIFLVMIYNLIWRTKLSKWSRFKLDSFVLPQPWTEQSVKCFWEVNLSSPLLSYNSKCPVLNRLLGRSDILCISDGIRTNNYSSKYHQQAGSWTSPGKLIIRNLGWLRLGFGHSLHDRYICCDCSGGEFGQTRIHNLSSSIKGRPEI